MKITPYDLNETTQKIEDEIRRLDSSNESISGTIESNQTEKIEDSSEEIIAELLEEANIIDKVPEGADSNTKLKSYLNQFGGSLERVAQNIVGIMDRGDTDSGRLKAAEFISKMHGVQVQLEESNKDNNAKQGIIININGTDSKTMINFFMPKS